MRIIVLALILIVNLIFDSTIFQYSRIMGIKPDFIIVIVVSYAILRGSSYSSIIGLTAGILVDMMYGKVFGINAISYMITGYVIGMIHENVFKDSVLPAIIFNFAAVFVCQHIFFIFSYLSNNLIGLYGSYIYILTRIILPQCFYNMIIGGLIYKYFYKLDEMEFMDRRIY